MSDQQVIGFFWAGSPRYMIARQLDETGTYWLVAPPGPPGAVMCTKFDTGADALAAFTKGHA